MTAEHLIRVWKDAQLFEGEWFYDKLQMWTGLTKEQVTTAFADWNKLSHADAVAIAERHGVTVAEGGFQAYLAEKYSQPPVQETL